jgi:hypothetical protein
MKKPENDPDTLQYLDETNVEWAKLWNNKAKQKLLSKELKMIMAMPEIFQEVTH